MLNSSIPMFNRNGTDGFQSNIAEQVCLYLFPQKKNWKNILIIFTVKCIQLIIKHGWQSKIATGMQPALLKQKISLTSLRMENGTVETAISRIPILQEEFKILRKWAIR